jgi:hypothetical protein
VKCHTGCTDCTKYPYSFRDCAACDTPYALNNAPTGETHKFCVSVCPTHFDDSVSSGNCALSTSSQEKIVEYDFGKVPLGTDLTAGYSNSGHASVADIVFETDSESGMPSKFRGIYFNGDNGTPANKSYIQPEFVLNHSCSIHLWLLRLAEDADHTVLDIVRDDFDGDVKDSQFLRLFINGSNRMALSFAKDSHSATNESYTTKAD